MASIKSAMSRSCRSWTRFSHSRTGRISGRAGRRLGAVQSDLSEELELRRQLGDQRAGFRHTFRRPDGADRYRPGAGRRRTLQKDMEAQGIRPGDIGIVIFTHLHYDHTGWAVVDGKPFFANARYLAPEADWANLGNSAALFAEVVAMKPLQDSGRLELLSGEKSVTPEISLLPTPGHTRGTRASLSHRPESAPSCWATSSTTRRRRTRPSGMPASTSTRTLPARLAVGVMERLEQDGSLVASGIIRRPASAGWCARRAAGVQAL